MIDKNKIKIKLKKYLGREPKKNELINAEKDQNIINEIIIDEINLIKIEIDKLKGK